MKKPGTRVTDKAVASIARKRKKNITHTHGFITHNRHELLLFYLSLARDLARDLSLDLARDGAHDLAFDQASDLSLDLANVYALVQARDFSRDLVFDLAIDLSLSFATVSFIKDDTDFDLDDFLSRARDLVHLLTTARHQALPPARDLDHILNLHLNRTFNINRILSAGLNIGRLLAKSIILLLESLNPPTYNVDPYYLTLSIDDPTIPIGGFTSDYLLELLMPYLTALTEMQHVIDEIHKRPLTDIRVLGIRYSSISIDITGGIRDTVELILDNVVKWRRENKKKLAKLEAAQKEIEIQQKEVEIEQAKATITTDAEQAEDKARLVRAQAHKQELENQKVQLEIMKMALEMVNQVKPGLADEQRLLYAMKMVDPTRLIATSPLEITDVEVVEEENKETKQKKTTPNQEEKQ